MLVSSTQNRPSVVALSRPSIPNDAIGGLRKLLVMTDGRFILLALSCMERDLEQRDRLQIGKNR